MVCPLWVLSDVLGWERVLSQAQGGRWKPSPIPSRSAQLSALLHPQTEPEPCGDEQGELDDQEAFPAHQRAFKRQTNSSPGWCRGWALPACRQGAEVALKSARRTEKGASSQCQQGSRQSRHRNVFLQGCLPGQAVPNCPFLGDVPHK